MLTNRRILYVQPSELFGGAERQIAAVLPQFQKQGVAVTALVVANVVAIAPSVLARRTPPATTLRAE